MVPYGNKSMHLTYDVHPSSRISQTGEALSSLDCLRCMLIRSNELPWSRPSSTCRTCRSSLASMLCPRNLQAWPCNFILFMSHWTKTRSQDRCFHLWVTEQSIPNTGINTPNEHCPIICKRWKKMTWSSLHPWPAASSTAWMASTAAFHPQWQESQQRQCLQEFLRQNSQHLTLSKSRLKNKCIITMHWTQTQRPMTNATLYVLNAKCSNSKWVHTNKHGWNEWGHALVCYFYRHPSDDESFWRTCQQLRDNLSTADAWSIKWTLKSGH